MKRLENGNFELTEKELVNLIMCQEELTALEGAGVDNWEGYDYKYEYLEEAGQDSFIEYAKNIVNSIQ